MEEREFEDSSRNKRNIGKRPHVTSSKQHRGAPSSRIFESNGPDVKLRGNASSLAEKYASLARDAHTSGDRVLIEALRQHEHHYRSLTSESSQVAKHFFRGSTDSYDSEQYGQTAVPCDSDFKGHISYPELRESPRNIRNQHQSRGNNAYPRSASSFRSSRDDFRHINDDRREERRSDRSDEVRDDRRSDRRDEVRDDRRSDRRSDRRNEMYPETNESDSFGYSKNTDGMSELRWSDQPKDSTARDSNERPRYRGRPPRRQPSKDRSPDSFESSNDAITPHQRLDMHDERNNNERFGDDGSNWAERSQRPSYQKAPPPDQQEHRRTSNPSSRSSVAENNVSLGLPSFITDARRATPHEDSDSNSHDTRANEITDSMENQAPSKKRRTATRRSFDKNPEESQQPVRRTRRTKSFSENADNNKTTSAQ